HRHRAAVRRAVRDHGDVGIAGEAGQSTGGDGADFDGTETPREDRVGGAMLERRKPAVPADHPPPREAKERAGDVVQGLIPDLDEGGGEAEQNDPEGRWVGVTTDEERTSHQPGREDADLDGIEAEETAGAVPGGETIRAATGHDLLLGCGFGCRGPAMNGPAGSERPGEACGAWPLVVRLAVAEVADGDPPAMAVTVGAVRAGGRG